MSRVGWGSHFSTATFLVGERKEMAWSERSELSELIGWMNASTRPTHGF
jgi:hypothetical protein